MGEEGSGWTHERLADYVSSVGVGVGGGLGLYSFDLAGEVGHEF